MRRFLFVLGLATVVSSVVGAQTPPKKTSRLKQLFGKIVDTAATTAAATATDSLLGAKAATVAGLVGAAQPSANPTCPPGTMMVPAPASAAAQPQAPPSAGGFLVDMAKKRLAKKADSTPPAATPARYVCTPHAQASAAQASLAPAATAVATTDAAPAAVSKQERLVTGAIAAAPIATQGARALSGMMRNVSKDNVIRDLARGHLELKTVRFIEGSDALKAGFENELMFVAEALQSVEGQFLLVIPPEASGNAAADAVMVRRRLLKLFAYLQVAGIDETRVSAVGGLTASLKHAPSRPGETRVEIVRVTEETKP